MLNWLSDNLGTAFITLLLIGIVIAAILIIRRDKKKGKSACGGSCGHCPMGSSCHQHQ